MTCNICSRSSEDTSLFEYHHFEPIQTRRKSEEKVQVCHQCGDQLHLLFTNTMLRCIGDDLAVLKGDKRVQKYVSWVKTKPLTTHFVSATKKRRK
jgi:hypothetical protein